MRGRVLLPAGLSSLLFFVVLELGLRTLHPVPFSAERNMYFDPDPYTGYRMRANSTGTFGAFIGAPLIRAHTNSHGHRDDETTLAKPPGILRVLALGDSMTVGTNVGQDEAYPQVVERRLAEGAGIPVEVVNAGVGGWSPFQYAQYYEHYGRAFAADVVLVGFTVGNDTFVGVTSPERLPTALRGRRVTRVGGRGDRALKQALLALYEHLHTVRLFVNARLFAPGDDALRAVPDEARDSDRLPAAYLQLLRPRLANHRPLGPEGRRLARNSIAQILRIQRLASEEGAELRVVLLPDEIQVNSGLRRALLRGDPGPPLDLSLPQARLSAALGAAGIATLDLLPRFAADPRRLYLNDGHWTPAGHRVAAEAIAGWLAPALRGRSAGRSPGGALAGPAAAAPGPEERR